MADEQAILELELRIGTFWIAMEAHSPGHKSEKGTTKLSMNSDSGVF